MTGADRRFLIALAILIVMVQALLLSPELQSLVPTNPTSSIRQPSVTTPDYTEYKSTFSCLPTKTESACAIHARYSFNRLETDRQPFGILVSDYNGNLGFLLNGQPLEPEMPASSVQRLMFALPVLVVFPENALRPGNNTFELTISTDLPLGALIHRVHIGKISALSDFYNTAFLTKWTIPRLVEGMLIATWIFCGYLVIWHGLKDYNSVFMFLTFICLAILYSILSLDRFGSDFRAVPVFLRLSSAIFVGVILAEQREHATFVSIKYILLFPMGLAIMLLQHKDIFEVLLIGQSFWIFVIGFSIVGLAIKVKSAYLERDIADAITVLVAGAAIVLNSFNVLAAFGYLNSSMIGARGYVVLSLVVIIAIKIFKTFSRNLILVRDANTTLTTEISRVRQELDLIYFKDTALKQQVTVQHERERLMGDLHDGLAGNLISINALAEHGKPAVLDEIRRLSKLALLDLRLVVDSLDTFDGELAVALAAFKERITPQYSGTPTKISWDTDHAPMIAALRPEVNLAIFRILQEAIANSVRHGRATRVHILVRASKCRHATASIWVLDNGTAAALSSPGFGMRNMQRRAEKIFANVYFRLHKDGSAVLLNI